MFKSLLFIPLLVLFSGCSGFQALVLSGPDVDQAIKLSEQYDVKYCGHVNGSAGYMTITGNGESYTAIGKGVEMIDCFKFFNPGVNVPEVQ